MMELRSSNKRFLSNFMSFELEAPASIMKSFSAICRSFPNLGEMTINWRLARQTRTMTPIHHLNYCTLTICLVQLFVDHLIMACLLITVLLRGLLTMDLSACSLHKISVCCIRICSRQRTKTIHSVLWLRSVLCALYSMCICSAFGIYIIY